MKYSVLMSVYYKEKAEYLKASMDSMWNQTIPPDEFVLVCDGPLNSELDAVIAQMESAHPRQLRVIRLKNNVGLGKALNVGLSHCQNDWIARMDSDDVARKDRCKRQLGCINQNSALDIVSGLVEEFFIDLSAAYIRRSVPEKHECILLFAKKRNPFNHPCVMYRKSAVQAAGGYKELYLMEDYFLWVRMLMNGAIGYNIQEPLLWMRAGENMYRRRAGWKYIKAQAKLFTYMRKNGFINGFEWITSMVIRSLSGLAPNWLRMRFFRRFLRE